MTLLRIVGRDPSVPGSPYLAGTDDSVEVPGALRLLNTSYLSIQTRSSDPTTVGSDGRLYAKRVSGVIELFWIKDDGTVVQITGSGGGGGGGSVGTRFRIQGTVSVSMDFQYLVQGTLVIEPGATLVVAPGAVLVNLP